ncbi:hypothetical protein VIA_002368 [Vibrio orientalis CIP 102891 = ATCC 33934]|uniref:Uncharacterized protein n=1 Tax=Vibrio orientalis CIP 102891 = ATCC 33934 TaxID=675816 RepID=A0ABP2GUV9_VIBOR|nr:hypothetical protein VIA_002368 [Vibrio orientalis CIP 102891 = ATCC 33934]
MLFTYSLFVSRCVLERISSQQNFNKRKKYKGLFEKFEQPFVVFFID